MTSEDKAPKRGLMIPASMGLRFQIPTDLERFTVTASWGTYERVKTGEVDKKGRAITVYQRTPVGITEPIEVRDLRPGRTVEKLLTGQVKLRIDVYDDARFGRLLVEIALCNDRVTPPSIPVSEWLFQTRLSVEAAGVPVFLPVRDVVAHDWPEQDDEVRRLHLQYRNRLEFAIGRTCSVDRAEPGVRRATAVWTTYCGGQPADPGRGGEGRDAGHGRPGHGHRRGAAAGAAGGRLRPVAGRAGCRG
jgi:hypothetical protein